MSGFFVAFAFGQLLVGPLSDHFGRKWLVIGGLAVFAAGSVLCAFAETLSFLVLGRVVQALGACAVLGSVARYHPRPFRWRGARAGSGADHDCGSGGSGVFAFARKCASEPVWLARHFPDRRGVRCRSGPALRDAHRRNAFGEPHARRSFGHCVRLYPLVLRSALFLSCRLGQLCHRRPLCLLRGSASHPDERVGPHRVSARNFVCDNGSDRVCGWISRPANGSSVGAARHRHDWSLHRACRKPFHVRVRRHADLHALHHSHRAVPSRHGIDQSARHRNRTTSLWTTGRAGLLAARLPPVARFPCKRSAA